MKKVILTPMIVVVLTVLSGADIRRQVPQDAETSVKKKNACYGYTIVEFGKGIDCNGDTVKLAKINGVQELVREPS